MSDERAARRDDVDAAVVERAIRSAPVGVTITDADAVEDGFVYVNKGFARLTGRDCDGLLGRRLPSLVADETDEDAVAAVVDAIEAPGRATVDLVVERADGSTFVDEVRIQPVAGDDGEYVLGLHVDVTAEREERRELERENERLDEFASIVSHDLKNPLGVASKRLEEYREEHDDPRLEQVERGVRRMEDLIDNLLAVARHGREVSPSAAVELEDVAEAAWENVETRDAELAVEGTATLTADRESMTRVLENLFKNAIEHAGEDVEVTVGVTSGGFYVEDDGPGIAEVERGSVFDRGYSDSGGTGFGLYIVHSIADAHGWDVAVDAGESGGARFVFETRGTSG